MNKGFAISNGNEMIHFRGWVSDTWETITYNKDSENECRENLIDYYKRLAEESGLSFGNSIAVYEFSGEDKNSLTYRALCGRMFP